MKRWWDVLTEEPSKDYAHRVTQAASVELEINRAQNPGSNARRRFTWGLAGGFGLLGLAALGVYQTLRREGTQKNSLPAMQTRAELYEYLGYHDYEQKLDALFAAKKTMAGN